MKKIATYIDGEKFQFITCFEKKEILNSKGEKMILDFGELTIDERIFLSSYLTYLVKNEGKENDNINQNLYDIIFNFNNRPQRKDTEGNIKTTYHNSFISTISNFLKDKPHFVSYLKDTFNDIVNNKTVIHRTQLNRSEMDILYSLKFQRSYNSLCTVLYIIGVAKSNTVTIQLNKLPLDRIYKTSSSLSKKRIEEIMKKLNIKYKIENGMVYFGNGFNIDLDEKYTSEAKKKYFNQINEEDILKSLFDNDEEEEIVETEVLNKKEVKTEIEVSKIITPELKEELELLKYEAPTKVKSIDIGDGRFDSSVFDCIEDKLMENPNFLNSYVEKLFPNTNERGEKFRKVLNKLGNPQQIIMEDKLLKEYVENPEYCFKNDKEWKVKKDICKQNILKIAKTIYKGFEDIYDKNKNAYTFSLYMFCIAYKSMIKAIKYAENNNF